MTGQGKRLEPEYADRVIVEYKRFLFLAVTCSHVVCPSEQVDQAWHLHLTYTRSYWERIRVFRVLGRSLHHSPTKGGRAELTKFVDLYNQTLDSYVAAFGQAPPEDIWSPTEQRFGDDAKHVTVNIGSFPAVLVASASRVFASRSVGCVWRARISVCCELELARMERA